MDMKDLLRSLVREILEEMHEKDARVPVQLLPPGDSKKDKTNDKEEKEMEEVSVVANIAGYTAPLGASSADMGRNPVKPGQRTKKRKKNFVRWK